MTEFHAKEQKEDPVNPDTVTLFMNLNHQTAEKLQKLKGAGSWEALMKELLDLRREKLEAEAP